MEWRKVLLAISAVLAVICLTACELESEAEVESSKPASTFETDEMYGAGDAPNEVPEARQQPYDHGGYNPCTDTDVLWLK